MIRGYGKGWSGKPQIMPSREEIEKNNQENSEGGLERET